MLTYIYLDGERIARFGGALKVDKGSTIYLDELNIPYQVINIRYEGSGQCCSQHVDVLRDLSQKQSSLTQPNR